MASMGVCDIHQLATVFESSLYGHHYVICLLITMGICN